MISTTHSIQTSNNNSSASTNESNSSSISAIGTTTRALVEVLLGTHMHQFLALIVPETRPLFALSLDEHEKPLLDPQWLANLPADLYKTTPMPTSEELHDFLTEHLTSFIKSATHIPNALELPNGSPQIETLQQSQPIQREFNNVWLPLIFLLNKLNFRNDTENSKSLLIQTLPVEILASASIGTLNQLLKAANAENSLLHVLREKIQHAQTLKTARLQSPDIQNDRLAFLDREQAARLHQGTTQGRTRRRRSIGE